MFEIQKSSNTVQHDIMMLGEREKSEAEWMRSQAKSVQSSESGPGPFQRGYPRMTEEPPGFLDVFNPARKKESSKCQ